MSVNWHGLKAVLIFWLVWTIIGAIIWAASQFGSEYIFPALFLLFWFTVISWGVYKSNCK